MARLRTFWSARAPDQIADSVARSTELRRTAAVLARVACAPPALRSVLRDGDAVANGLGLTRFAGQSDYAA